MFVVGDTILLEVPTYTTKTNGFRMMNGVDFYEVVVTKVTEKAVQFSGKTMKGKSITAWYQIKALQNLDDNTYTFSRWFLNNATGWSATFMNILLPMSSTSYVTR